MKKKLEDVRQKQQAAEIEKNQLSIEHTKRFDAVQNLEEDLRKLKEYVHLLNYFKNKTKKKQKKEFC